MTRLVAVFVVFALAGCGGKPGACGVYTDTAGTAHITSISGAPSGQNNCPKDPVQVLFDFTPADPTKAYLAASGVALTIGEGMNPPRAWVSASGITVGAVLPAKRADGPPGPCPPTVISVTGLDWGAAIAACF